MVKPSSRFKTPPTISHIIRGDFSDSRPGVSHRALYLSTSLSRYDPEFLQIPVETIIKKRRKRVSSAPPSVAYVHFPGGRVNVAFDQGLELFALLHDLIS